MFHSRIASACGNELLSYAFDEVKALSLRTSEMKNATFGSDTGLYHHVSILEALRYGDQNATFEALSNHLLYALDSIF